MCSGSNIKKLGLIIMRKFKKGEKYKSESASFVCRGMADEAVFRVTDCQDLNILKFNNSTTYNKESDRNGSAGSGHQTWINCI